MKKAWKIDMDAAHSRAGNWGRKSKALLFGCGLTGLLLGGCLDFEDSELMDDEVVLDEDIGSDSQEIVIGANTVTDTNTNPRWPAVVQIGGSCSGTLVSPVHVLTAGHCRTRAGARVRLDTPAGSGSGSGSQYRVVQVKTLSPNVASGSDLALLLLDRAVPSFGTQGAPQYSVKPAFALARISNRLTTWTVGFGFGNDCAKTNFGVRRGLPYRGGFSTYIAKPGIITRRNLPCSNVNKGPSPGDSGGPLLDSIGRVVGVFSGWYCRDAAGNNRPGCTSGTIEWTGWSPANAAWLTSAKAGDFDGDGIADIDDPSPNLDCRGSAAPWACRLVKPDLEVIRIAAAGCTGTGGDPTVSVTVRNNGPVAARGWVDLFPGRSTPPSVGIYSSIYRMSNVLAQRQTQTLTFTIPRDPGRIRFDAIVDTTRSVDELSEYNNLRSASIVLPDCSFN